MVLSLSEGMKGPILTMGLNLYYKRVKERCWREGVDRIDMNSFGVNTLSYIVSTSLTYKTSDRYRGFRIQLKEKEKENKTKYSLFFQLIFQSIKDWYIDLI